eukprot:snap_masked-scaffold_6-processed-gene-12.26-mRNA-1 protein AED:1.00 eAED:1.00 QI:0/0/0/0/1/1/2/0/282
MRSSFYNLTFIFLVGIGRCADITYESLLEAATKSPQLALAQDKEGWLRLFAKNATVGDPAGTPAHNLEALPLFYDTFIDSNRVEFEVLDDFIDLNQLIVVRSVNIHIIFDNGGKQIQPAVIKYMFDINFKVTSLRAYWSIFDSKPVYETPGDILSYLAGAAKAFGKIFYYQGGFYTASYLRSLVFGYLNPGKGLVEAFMKGQTLLESKFLFPNKPLVYLSKLKKDIRPTELFSYLKGPFEAISSYNSGAEFTVFNFHYESVKPAVGIFYIVRDKILSVEIYA